MPPPIQLSLFLFFSALPNELKEEIKKELTGTAAPRESMNGIKLIFNLFDGMVCFPRRSGGSHSISFNQTKKLK